MFEIYEEAIGDPACAIFAYWGIALSLLLSNRTALLRRPIVPLGLSAIEKANAVDAKTAARADYQTTRWTVMYVDYDKNSIL